MSRKLTGSRPPRAASEIKSKPTAANGSHHTHPRLHTDGRPPGEEDSKDTCAL
ncbi:hypothetical protein ACFQ0Q_46170 [Streptomyces aureus]